LALINMLWPFSEISPLEKRYLDTLCMWGWKHMGMNFLWIMLSKDIQDCWFLTYFWNIELNQFTICKVNIHKPYITHVFICFLRAMVDNQTSFWMKICLLFPLSCSFTTLNNAFAKDEFSHLHNLTCFFFLVLK